METAYQVFTPRLGIHPRPGFALEFMRAHCGEHLTLARVAECVGLSGSRLRHLLRAETGVTFSAHLREFRLLMAKSLLADCSLQVRQVAYRCGYQSVPSFSRDFKRRFGMSPSRYRRAGFGNAATIPLKMAA